MKQILSLIVMCFCLATAAHAESQLRINGQKLPYNNVGTNPVVDVPHDQNAKFLKGAALATPQEIEAATVKILQWAITDNYTFAYVEVRYDDDIREFERYGITYSLKGGIIDGTLLSIGANDVELASGIYKYPDAQDYEFYAVKSKFKSSMVEGVMDLTVTRTFEGQVKHHSRLYDLEIGVLTTNYKIDSRGKMSLVNSGVTELKRSQCKIIDGEEKWERNIPGGSELIGDDLSEKYLTLLITPASNRDIVEGIVNLDMEMNIVANKPEVIEDGRTQRFMNNMQKDLNAWIVRFVYRKSQPWFKYFHQHPDVSMDALTRNLTSDPQLLGWFKEKAKNIPDKEIHSWWETVLSKY